MDPMARFIEAPVENEAGASFLKLLFTGIKVIDYANRHSRSSLKYIMN